MPTPPVESYRDRTQVVLVRPLKCGNVGASARAMKNMGLRRLHLVAPQEERFQDARRMAPGAHDVLEAAQRHETVEQAIAGCTWVVGATVRGRRLRWPVLEPRELASQLLRNQGPVALLFGPEDSGLSNLDLSLCHSLVSIPTDAAPSLNLAQAVLIVAHHIFEEARRQGYQPPPRRRRSRRGHREYAVAPTPPAPGPGDVLAPAEFMLNAVHGAVDILGRTAYLNGRSREQVALTLYQLLQRTSPAKREVAILLGMIGKLRYSLDHPRAEEGD